MLLRNLSSNSPATLLCVIGARDLVSVLLSVTVTGNPPLILQIEPDCLGIMRGGCSTEPGLYVCGDGNWFSMCWNSTPSLWPRVSPPPPRCGPHTSCLLIDPFGTPCVLYVCARPCVWSADGRLRRFFACRTAFVLWRMLCSFGALVWKTLVWSIRN